MTAFNTLVSDREQLKKDYSEVMNIITDISEFDAMDAELNAELEVVSELIAKTVAENASVAQEQDDYNQRYSTLSARYEKIKGKIDSIAAERNRRAVTRENALYLLETVDKGNILDDFDEATWCALVERVTVSTDGSMAATFKDGQTVEVKPNI